MNKAKLTIILASVLIFSCTPNEQYRATDLLGLWEGHLVENHELSYAFDTRGYLPVKVIDLSSTDQVKYNFGFDFVSIPGEKGVQSYRYAIDNESATPELILFNEDKTLRMEILKFNADSLELRLPDSEQDNQVLNRYYLLLREWILTMYPLKNSKGYFHAYVVSSY